MDKQLQRISEAFIIYLKKIPRKKNMEPIQVGNLLFEDKHTYKKLCKLDKYIKIVDKCLEKGYLQVDDLFSMLRLVEVKQFTDDGYLELFDLFPNSRNLITISYGVVKDKSLYEIGRRFFRKFDVINESGENVNIFTGDCHVPLGNTIFGLVDK